MLDAREAFFLRRGHDLAVDHQRRGRVVVEGGDAEDRGWFLAHHSVEFITGVFGWIVLAQWNPANLVVRARSGFAFGYAVTGQPAPQILLSS